MRDQAACAMRCSANPERAIASNGSRARCRSRADDSPDRLGDQPKHQGHFRVNTAWVGSCRVRSDRNIGPSCVRNARCVAAPYLLRDPASRRGGSALHVNDERIRAYHLAEPFTAGTPRPRWDDTGDHASRNSSGGQTVSSLRYLSACYGFARRLREGASCRLRSNSIQQSSWKSSSK